MSLRSGPDQVQAVLTSPAAFSSDAGEYSLSSEIPMRWQPEATANFAPPAMPTPASSTSAGPSSTSTPLLSPGPGTYEATQRHYSGAAVAWDVAPRRGCASAFKAPERRVHFGTCKDSPPACSYSVTKVHLIFYSDGRRSARLVAHPVERI